MGSEQGRSTKLTLPIFFQNCRTSTSFFYLLTFKLRNILLASKSATPPRTHFISFEMTIFGLKMKVKSGLEFFMFILNEPLQSCCCPVQKNQPRKAELAWQVSSYLWRGSFNFKIKKSRPLFTIIFKPKIVISRVKSLVHLKNEF